MSHLIIADHTGAALAPATLSAVTAARASGGGPMRLVVLGQGIDGAVAAARAVEGVDEVLFADADALAHGLAENLAPAVAALASACGATHVWAPANTFGKNLMPRAAALMDVQPVSDIIRVEGPNTYVRPIYAGNVLATVRAPAAPAQVVTVRATAFLPASASGGDAPARDVLADGTVSVSDSGLTRFVEREDSAADRPELTAARVVVSGGRGLGSAENFALLEALADRLDAALGASRAAVDAGFVPNDWQVGQTGKVVAPDLYVAVGISGAIQHLAGMKDSKVIVAINKDPDAPIFQVADYGLAADLFEAVPELTAALSKND